MMNGIDLCGSCSHLPTTRPQNGRRCLSAASLQGLRSVFKGWHTRFSRRAWCRAWSVLASPVAQPPCCSLLVALPFCQPLGATSREDTHRRHTSHHRPCTPGEGRMGQQRVDAAKAWNEPLTAGRQRFLFSAASSSCKLRRRRWRRKASHHTAMHPSLAMATLTLVRPPPTTSCSSLPPRMTWRARGCTPSGPHSRRSTPCRGRWTRGRQLLSSLLPPPSNQAGAHHHWWQLSSRNPKLSSPPKQQQLPVRGHLSRLHGQPPLPALLQHRQQ